MYYLELKTYQYQVFIGILFISIMRTSDQLFDLIHSLKKEEKRHFKVYSKKYAKTSDYLQLFDAIANLKHYDEARLREQLSGVQSLNRLSVGKDYLYTLILRSLRDTEPVTPEIKVLKLIEDISILLDRRLFSAAKKRIRKATELARMHDLTGALFTLGELEALLPDSRRDQLFEDQRLLLKQSNQIYELGIFAELLRVFSEEKGLRRTEEDALELSQILSGCPYKNPEELLTFSAKLRYHLGWYKYYKIVGDADKAIRSLRSLINLYDEHPEHIRTQQLAYVTILINLCLRELRAGNLTTIPEYLGRVRTLGANGQIKPYCELLLFGFALHEALASQDWNRMDELHESLPDLLTRNTAEVNSFGKDIRIDYYLLFAKAYFLRKRFDATLAEINQILQLPSLSAYPYQENNVRVLLLVTHYELGNLSYLPYLIRSTYRGLLRRERLFEFEACILHYLGSLVRIKKQKEIIPSFQQLLSEIKLLSAHPIEGEFPWRGFYIDWLEKRISGQS